ncbi:hypothetical protein [Acinetobacter johnsonii]|uniref:hypothetical protein n=1 Tax=Acinetobacter johnsonii TaxID=40214 RepID=UPI001A2948C2|nr:hypothetical protein [Acinetobacter sp.]USI87564.1 hypothetical protein LZ086_05380 [Acinetobacter johnsonii]
MAAYTDIKVGKYEDDMIPKLAIHAFHDAFQKAITRSSVVYAKAEQLVERDIHGNETVLQDLSNAYVDVGVLPTLTRKKKHATV